MLFGYKYNIGDFVIVDSNNSTGINEKDQIVEGIIMDKKKLDGGKAYVVKVINEGPYYNTLVGVYEKYIVKKSRDIVIRYPSNLPSFTEYDLSVLMKYHDANPDDTELAAIIAKIKYYRTIGDFKVKDLIAKS